MVNTSLFSGLSGLRAHQLYIDVIGANLANVSTAGYRGSRVTFSDLLSLTTSPGARPEGDFGGTNPRQVGLGTSIGSIDLNTRQGTFQDTGRPLDVALEGRGFFALTDGTQTYYSRVGTFGVDARGSLVDLRNGFRVIGASGSPVHVPVTDTLPAQATSRITFHGSLPATVTGPLQEILQSENPFLAGSAATKDGGATSGTTFDMSRWLDKTLLVSINGGTARSVTFTASDFANVTAATPSEIAAAFSALGQDLVATGDDSTGALSFATVRLGEAATLKFDEETGSTGLLAHLGLDTVLTTGSEEAATAATDLAGLTSRNTPYAAGDRIRVTGTNPDGTPFSATFTYDTDGRTVGELVDFVNGLIAPGEAALTLDGAGHLVLTATDTGEAALSLHVGDAGSPARNAWPTFLVSQDGTGPDTATASIDLFDSLGRAHAVNFTFTRSVGDPSVWDMVAELADGNGTISTSEISSIRFNSDGSFNSIGGGNSTFAFQFGGIDSTQTVTIDLGRAGGFDGVTMLGDDTSIAATDQDGFASGTLLNVGFDQAGNLSGYYSNGQNRTIDTLRVAMFQNEEGLQRAGDTLFVTAPNSDDPIAARAGTSGAGLVRPGSLENSNVDIAEEFVSLIEAQRGFQANSRVITTTDEILAELVNIVS
ncbi:MAG: flagellar hook-basal body complex protein [Planctomycetes bacterium]|nr:flagellar hook-basal body complex protein [Planctomycetota bacterium]